jgi:hypothetical protein
MEYLQCKCTQALQCFIPGKIYKQTNKQTTKLARLGHFPPATQEGCLAGPVFYVYVFSLGGMMGKIERTMGGGEGRYYWNCRYMSAVRPV